MADVDSKLVAALRQAKTMPMYFAFIAKGTTDGVLLVAKKKISVKEINEAKAASGGRLVFRGRCGGEEGKMVFDVPKEPPSTLAKQIKTVIHRDAGLTMNVEMRVATDLEEEEGETAHEETPPPQTSVPSAPPPPLPHKGDDAAHFAARLKALMPVLQKAEATGHSAVKLAHARVNDANAAFKHEDHRQANALLGEAEALIKQALQTGLGTQPPSGTSNVVYTQTRLAWDQTRKKIQADLQNLEKSILAVCLDAELDEKELDFSTLAADTKSLYTILDKLDERLIDKLDDALNAATPEKRSKHQAQAAKIVKEYLAFVEGDELMQAIDNNGFAPIAVRKTAQSALQLLASKL